MPNTQETLAAYVRRVMTEKTLSLRSVAKQSAGHVSHSTVSDIISGKRLDVKKDTLIALAKGLGVPADDIFRIARGLPIGMPDRFRGYAETFDAHEISKSEWQMLESFFHEHVKTWQRFQIERKNLVSDDGNE